MRTSGGGNGGGGDVGGGGGGRGLCAKVLMGVLEVLVVDVDVVLVLVFCVHE